MFCNGCGKEINEKAVICMTCGDTTRNPVPRASYQPMAGFFLSILLPFLPFIGFIVSTVQLIKAFTRKGLWVFPLLGLIISIVFTVLLISWVSLAIELLNGMM